MLGQPLPTPSQAGPGQTKLCHLLADEALLRRLSGNTAGSGEDCVSALRSLNLPDSFWTDEFKVVPCAKTYSHKWTLCPCAHIGETARRRCPRTINYKAVLCPLVKAKKTCPLGDSCTYAHNVFEHWLHPSRYKTRLCSFGRNCNRSICFFAHSAEELRCVPISDDEKADESGYLMQLLMAQESGLLPSAPSPLQPPPAMPPLGLLPDLNSALQQALNCPLPPSNRPSINGLPDTSPLITGRPSISGMPDLMSNRPSLSGMQDAASASFLAARASYSGIPEGPGGGLMMPGRHSLNGHGLGDHSGLMGGRSSLTGLQDMGFGGMGGMGGGAGRGRPSMSGVPTDPANMLLSMSMQSSMQRALSSELNGSLHAAAMQRALSSDLNVGAAGPFHSAAAAMSMQRAMSSDLNVGGAPYHAAAAAAAAANAAFNGGNGAAAAAAAAQAAAMERALSRELGGGATSPLQSAAAAAALERAYSNRELSLGGGVGGGMNSGPGGGGGTGGMAPNPERAYTNSRSIGSSVSRDLSLAHTTSVNSVESDSLIHMHGSGLSGLGHIGGGAVGMGGGGMGGGGHPGFDLGQLDPHAPSRLSDPGNTFHMHGQGMQKTAGGEAGGSAAMAILGQDLAGLESLLPLVNNALASGALSLPPSSSAATAPTRDLRHSNSGVASGASGRVVSPPLHDAGPVSGSPTHSGTLTPLSPTSAAGGGDAEAAALHQFHMQQQQQQLLLQQQAMHVRRQPSAGSPPPAAECLAQEAMAGAANGGAAAGTIDQAYLNDLVVRLQESGVNKDQLVSSLSQLLASLLSVGN